MAASGGIIGFGCCRLAGYMSTQWKTTKLEIKTNKGITQIFLASSNLSHSTV